MKVQETVKLGLTLMIYATIACVGLAFVYARTKADIDRQDLLNLEMAIKEIFPDSDGFTDIGSTIQSADSAVIFENQYGITTGGTLTGAAIQASTGSFNGPIKVLVGVNSLGTISSIKIMSHTDTPGLGANAANDKYFVNRSAKITFYGQFTGKKITDPFEVKKDVDAITAATITSDAVSRIVRSAGQAAYQWLVSEGAGQ